MSQVFNKVSQVFHSYRELFRFGHIQGTAEGEMAIVQIQVSITGDVLTFFALKDNNETSLAEKFEIINTDATLNSKIPGLFSELKTKLTSLSRLPKLIFRLISIVIILLLALKIKNVIPTIEKDLRSLDINVYLTHARELLLPFSISIVLGRYPMIIVKLITWIFRVIRKLFDFFSTKKVGE